ncbi:hypothetical protein NDK43_06945 [Neobacillus pocheonensis]|uniref:GNAT family N-acetyltransferase n=1 Tax=Neobacillus pocheonensis TaxID=363869 RepID=A0ABT0W799_9BACI|nr:hypothetical protein [Neobacillus pocheonensis]
MATEKWNAPLDNLESILPIKEIKEVLGKDPNIKIYFDNEIRKINPSNYNMSITARAYNDNKDSKLKRYYKKYSDSFEYKDLMKINLPQILWKDTLGLDRTIIGLHISKLNKEELFINDVVLAKNEKLDGLKNGIFDIVLNNLENFAKNQGLKYISGHAMTKIVFDIFNSKGFLPDKRKFNRNDKLWEQSQIHGYQVPFLKKI